MKISARQIEFIPIKKLKPNPKNPKTHSDEQIDKIAASMVENGFTNPILVEPDFRILAGHGRWEAAKKIKFKEVPVIVLKGMTEVQKKKYLILDNKLSEFGTGWDDEVLQDLLLEIESENESVGDLGFGDDELKAIMEGAGLGEDGEPKGASGAKEKIKEDDDNVPEEIPKRVNTGDLWKLGNHFMLCGDSTRETDVNALIKIGSNPVLMVTDPPYGVNYDPAWREGADLGIGKRSKGKVKNDDQINWTAAWDLFSGNVSYIWHASWFTNIVADELDKQNFERKYLIIWNKHHFVLGRGDYHWKHEPCWYAVRKGKKHNWQGARDQSTVWEIKNNNSFGNSKPEERFGHGTQKPIDCMLIPILNNSKEGQTIYDPFGGTGTTLIAAEKTDRKCLTIEIDPRYCDIILKRWETFSELNAELIKNLYD